MGWGATRNPRARQTTNWKGKLGEVRFPIALLRDISDRMTFPPRPEGHGANRSRFFLPPGEYRNVYCIHFAATQVMGLAPVDPAPWERERRG